MIRKPAMTPREKQIMRLIGFIVLCWSMQSVAGPQETPVGPRWWPSEWGAGDQRGAANRITPSKVLEAGRLIRTGKIYSLGQVYQEGMPLAGKRHFKLTIPGSPTSGDPTGTNGLVGFDEMFSGEIGQVGTQFDGLGHVGVRLADDDYFYNGFRRSQFATPLRAPEAGRRERGRLLHPRSPHRRGFVQGCGPPAARLRHHRGRPEGCPETAGRGDSRGGRGPDPHRPRKTLDAGQRPVQLGGSRGSAWRRPAGSAAGKRS